MDLNFDILNQIYGFLDFLSKIRFRQISKYFLDNFYIHNLYDLNYIFLEKISEQILISHPKIKSLNILENGSIQNIDCLSNLQNLAVSYKFKNQFTNYNLKKLKISNYLIKNLKYFTKLEKLKITNTGLSNSDFDGLNLRQLNIICDNISNINHMTRLKKLYICQNSKIQNSNIQNLNLVKLDIESCFGITEINFLTNLRYLRLNNNIIYNLSNINLTELIIIGYISDFSHMTNLTNLTIMGDTKINLSKINLSELYIQGNYSDFSHMTNLIKLDMANYRHQISLNNLYNLKYLDCNSANIQDQDILNINPEKIIISYTKITDISHLTNLRELDADNSKITKITNLNLEKININGKTNIKKINLPKLKYLTAHITSLEELDCPNLVQLYCSGNLTNLNILKNLKKLILWNSLTIYNTSIQNLNLQELYLSNIHNLTDLNYLTSLKILSIEGPSGLTNTSIQKLDLLELVLRDNITITDINNFQNLRELFIAGPETGLNYPGVKYLNQTKTNIIWYGIPDIFKKPDI